jgi:hypothetical protein
MSGFGMPEIDEGSGRAHGGEGSCGDHVHITGRLFGTAFFDNANHLIGCDHNDLSLFNLFIDVVYGFRNLLFAIGI